MFVSLCKYHNFTQPVLSAEPVTVAKFSVYVYIYTVSQKK